MSDKPFRVLLDLTDLHFECFKFVWISVSPREIRTIADLKTSILHKINLAREDIKLFIRDGLLLDKETIAVLREDDTVKIQYEGQLSFDEGYTSKLTTEQRNSRKRNFDECNHEDVASNIKKHKRNKNMVVLEEEVEYEDMNVKRKKKLNQNTSDKDLNIKGQTYFQNLEESASCTSEALHTSTKKSKKNKTQAMNEVSLLGKSAKSNISDVPVIDNHSNKKDAVNLNTNGIECEISKNTTESTTEITSNHKKKRRKRYRKCKKRSQPVIVEDLSLVDPESDLQSIVDTSSDISKRKHIIYSSPNPCVAYNDSTELITLDVDENEDIQNISYETYTKRNSTSDKPETVYVKVSTPAQPNENLNPNWDVSLMQNELAKSPNLTTHSVKREIVKTEHKEPIIDNVTFNRVPKKCFERDQKKNYADLPPLNSFPEIGTTIAYKVLELDENYSPAVSEYREGVVRNIDPETQEIKIELLKYQIKPARVGKFENLETDVLPPPEIKKEDIVSWSGLIEPKLLS